MDAGTSERVSPARYLYDLPNQYEGTVHDHSHGGSYRAIFDGALSYDRLIRDLFSTISGEFTRTEQNILSALRNLGPMSMSTLSDSLGISIAQASRTVKPLVEEGYVDRSHLEGNRRVVMVSITDKGLDYMAGWEASGFAVFEEMFSPLSEEEIDALARCTLEGSYLLDKARGRKIAPLIGRVKIDE